MLMWAAYHASHQPSMQDPPALRALLPLFYEKSATPAMVKHGMDIQKQAVDLNPGQIPVTTLINLCLPSQNWSMLPPF